MKSGEGVGMKLGRVVAGWVEMATQICFFKTVLTVCKVGVGLLTSFGTPFCYLSGLVFVEIAFFLFSRFVSL
jgi:hypothetical protein